MPAATSMTLHDGRPKFKENRRIKATPVELVYVDDCYYLISIEKDGQMRTRRVDRMRSVSLERDAPPADLKGSAFDLEEFAQCQFGMFIREKRQVTLLVKEDAMGALVDHFGLEKLDPMVLPGCKEALVKVDVFPSIQFFGWLTGLGDVLRLVGPEDVVEEYRKHLKKCLRRQSHHERFSISQPV